jgi:hypothetical protein
MNARLALLVMLALSAAGAPGPMSRPVPAAGANTRTVIAYAHEHTAYSLANSLTLLRLQLGRIDTDVETVPLAELNSNVVRRCQFLVVLAPDAPLQIASNTIAAIQFSTASVLWIGSGVEALESIADIGPRIRFGPDLHAARNVLFHGREWEVEPFSYRKAEFEGEPDAVWLTVAGPDSKAAAVCWRIGRHTIFSCSPQSGPLGFMFEDVLFDFFEVRQAAPSTILLRVGSYHPASNHRQVRRLADYLFARTIPFVLSVRGLTEQLTNRENLEFVSTLHYAQQRGGRLVMQGTASTDRGAEFWDFGADKEHVERPGAVGVRIASGLRTAFGAGLLPVAWETPQFAAARSIYRDCGSIFSTAIERVQLSDATGRDTYGPAGLSRDEYGRQILPDNTGYVSDSSNAVSRVEQSVELLSEVRGSLISSSFDAYLPLERLIELVGVLEQSHLPFLDLADFPNRVHLSDHILLTSTASTFHDLKDATIRWKTYNRAGELLAEDEQKTKASGHREFKRIGIGVFELVQFKNGSTK